MMTNGSVAAVRAAAAASPGSNMRGRFDDNRSRKQITVYLAYRSRASDERNERALARWNGNLRQQWEIEHLSLRQSASVSSGFPFSAT